MADDDTQGLRRSGLWRLLDAPVVHSDMLCDRDGRLRFEGVLDAWTFACNDAKLALADWFGAPVAERRDAFVAYRAALDREERAGKVLATAVAERAGTRSRR